MMFQELSLIGGLSIAENIFANRQPTGALNGIKWKKLYAETADFLKRFNVSMDPRQVVKRLYKGDQQILEFLKAISTNPKLLILDEPTSSLTETETAYLLENIRALRAQGMSFLYITHKLSEVFKMSDWVIVMRDGRYVGVRNTSECTEGDLIAMMVDREITNIYTKRSALEATGNACASKDSRAGMRFVGASFRLEHGEILGLSGLVGSGGRSWPRADIRRRPPGRGDGVPRGQGGADIPPRTKPSAEGSHTSPRTAKTWDCFSIWRSGTTSSPPPWSGSPRPPAS